MFPALSTIRPQKNRMRPLPGRANSVLIARVSVVAEVVGDGCLIVGPDSVGACPYLCALAVSAPGGNVQSRAIPKGSEVASRLVNAGGSPVFPSTTVGTLNAVTRGRAAVVEGRDASDVRTGVDAEDIHRCLGHSARLNPLAVVLLPLHLVRGRAVGGVPLDVHDVVGNALLDDDAPGQAHVRRGA